MVSLDSHSEFGMQRKPGLHGELLLRHNVAGARFEVFKLPS